MNKETEIIPQSCIRTAWCTGRSSRLETEVEHRECHQGHRQPVKVILRVIRVYGRPTYPGTEEAMAEDGDGGSP